MPLERLTMLVVDSGRTTLVVPELEAPRVRSGEFEIMSWKEIADPLDIVAALCPPEGRVAIGEQTWSGFLLGLQARLPSADFCVSGPLLRPLRIRKDPVEIEALTRAAATVDRVSEQIPDRRFSGRSEREVSREILEMMLDEGHHRAQFAIVGSGPNSASPHHEPSDRVIEEGDTVLIDFGGQEDGYCSDTTRTFVVGEPTREQSRLHEIVLAARDAAFAAVAVGVSAESVDWAARSVIAAAGYGDYFIHRVGHGIGVETHEHPYLVEGNTETLETGMAFSIEPGIYLPGRFGVRIEDIVAITESGPRSLNTSDRSLRHLA
jgi:Xaa-Pro aminopeptidase